MAVRHDRELIISLHDVDKNSLDRGAPQTNSSDVLDVASVKAHATHSVNYTTDASPAISDGFNGQFTIVQVGEYTTTATYNTTPPVGTIQSDQFLVLTQAHGLPYTPTAMGFYTSPGISYTMMPFIWFTSNAGGTSGIVYSWRVAVDDTNIKVILTTQTNGGAWSLLPGFTFKWYLMRQTSN